MLAGFASFLIKFFFLFISADLVLAELLLLTRLTTDARTALAFVAHQCARDATPPSLVRHAHFAAALLRHEPTSCACALRLRFALVQCIVPCESIEPGDGGGSGCRPVLELFSGDDGRLLYASVAGGVQGFNLASAQRFVSARGDTAMPFALEPAPLIDGAFVVRLTHVDVRNGAVLRVRPLFAVWHHTAFVDGVALVVVSVFCYCGTRLYII